MVQFSMTNSRARIIFKFELFCAIFLKPFKSQPKRYVDLNMFLLTN